MIPKEAFQWIVIIVGWLVIPIVSSQYFVSRRRTREQQLRELFGRPRVVERYLACKRPPPPRIEGESEANRVASLHEELAKHFDEQFKSEYGLQCYLIPSALATVLTGLVITLLVSQGFGGLIENLNLPRTVIFALLGAFFWTVWTVTRGYEGADLNPGTFFWIASRYLLCIPLGLLAKQVFADTVANLGAFIIATLPVDEMLKLMRSAVAKQVPGLTIEEGKPPLSVLQGLDRRAMVRLQERDICTTQQLAYTDPLQLLFQTNIDILTLADLMDQAFLYNYVGEKIEKLRERGIRGAIEMASLKDDFNNTQLIQSIATLLGISPEELKYFITMLYNDSQLLLIWDLAFSTDAAN